MTAATDHLIGKLDVSQAGIEVFTIEPVEWADASLDCPEPGKAYAQAITLGYRILLRVGEKEYEVHTDQSGQKVVVCERKEQEGRAAAVAQLAGELEIPSDEIEVLSVELYEWADTSLGCPEAGTSYAQVITPGYRVILETQGEKYEVHTDREGRVAVICEPEP
ncbi:MAG: hypothetical protein PVF54_08560 [Anaerolineae bacterium]|jgi:hypothetical protein